MSTVEAKVTATMAAMAIFAKSLVPRAVPLFGRTIEVSIKSSVFED